MNESKPHQPAPTAIPTINPSRLFPVPRLSTLIAIGVVGFLIYAFFTKLTLQFYASVVFLFYALTNSVWISVVMLGVFQTILMIPFRVVNLIKSSHIKEFRENFEKIKQERERQYLLKKSVKQGQRVALFYLVNFAVQVVSYTSIGRLFLTDFYSMRLDPELLYSFVPYPNYPIEDRFFKIPYLWFTDTVDLGMKWVWIIWLVILGLQAAIYIFKSMKKKMSKDAKMAALVGSSQERFLKAVNKYSTGYAVVFLLLAWVLIRHVPIGWELRIFSGDVSIPNPRFNALTAMATFITLVWVNIPKIGKQTDLARKAGMDELVIERTQRDLFKDTFRVAGFVGLGAYFITNQIPSAFELSIFTLEIISLFSPLTLDRLILSSRRAGGEKSNESKESEESKSE